GAIRKPTPALSVVWQVVLKIIKRYHEESQGMVDDRLKITNCFPFRQHTEDDYQMEMMRSSTYYGSFVSRALLDSQFSYQPAVDEPAVLIYAKMAQGSLSLKAYRLKKANIGFEHRFEEMPAVVRNPPLMNALMGVLDDNSTAADKPEPLSLSSGNHLEKSLQLLMDRMDGMSQEIVKCRTCCRNLRQINNYRQNVKEFTLENLGKLFMAEALQDHSS
uniref:Eukaryotic translation initiation factor 3, subunit H, a n=1 Tax=Pygocentrus nattereri TaxID=42514 RepID=A0AAR2L1K2_PYGNA